MAAFETVEDWRELAEKLRVLGQSVTDLNAKNTVFEMAAAYDELAQKKSGAIANKQRLTLRPR